MDWSLEFYTKQNQWSGVYEAPINEDHRRKAGWIEELTGSGHRRVLELGAGGGQVAAAMAALGHEVVAVEQVVPLVQHAQRLAAEGINGKLSVIQGDFYTVMLEGTFDVVCYYDGFGVGSDADQRRLLNRVAGWLSLHGTALIEVTTPWYAASVDGRGWQVGGAERRYSFAADGCRWNDSWWPIDQPEQKVQQSLRCYSPADLRLLLEPTGLRLEQVKPGGTVDWEAGKWLPSVPLERAMSYLAVLRRQE
ncbi:MAG: class I SAM-dependent methyltransferase [Caldilineaceae bacterium]